MTVPNVADPKADYGMPDGGFADYLKGVTDPTTDWTSGNPPNASATGGPGANQMIVDVAGMTRTAPRCWARFTAGASPVLSATNAHEAMWGNDNSVQPTPAHSATGVWTMTWPVSITDKLSVLRNINLRWARASVEGSTLAFVQWKVTSANVVTIYGFNTGFAANDLTGLTIFVEAG